MRITTLALLALALAPLAGCSSKASAPTVSPSLSPTPTTTAPVQLDSHARLACEQLDQAVRARAKADMYAEVNATRLEFQAVTSAKQTSVASMYDLVKDFTGETEDGSYVVRELRWWCQKHWAPGR